VPERALRLVVAAPEAGVRRTLIHDLEAAGFAVCALEQDASGAVEATIREEPDACLVAADLPGSAVVATGRIAEAVPRSKVVVLAASLDEDDCLTYLLVGASGYIRVDAGGTDLAAAVHAVVSGRAVVPPHAQRRLLEELRGRLD
jgi:DNA-binding NarL/FixJ family response regulator